MSAVPTALLWSQHSLGLGHLVRSLAIAGALSSRFRVVLLCGGTVPAHVHVPRSVELVELPALGSGLDGVLVSRHGGDVTAIAADRRRLVLETFATVRPDALVVELFPFGRKKFAGELEPLLAAARRRGTAVVCSLRDLLVRSRHDQDRHDERASTTANRWFDAVLVHADPALARLEETFRPRTPLAIPVHYTGFVVPELAPGAVIGGDREPVVLVSAGGGLVGEPLLATAVEAQRLLWRAHGLRMRVVCGPYLPADARARLLAAARDVPGLEIVETVTDLAGELTRSVASISQCGYNTALDVLRAGVPAIVVPFSEGREDEQTQRALRLARLGVARALEQATLTPRVLAAEVLALAGTSPARPSVALDGGARTAELVSGLVRARRAIGASR